MDLDEAADRIKFLIRDRDILYPPGFEHVSCRRRHRDRDAAPCGRRG